MIIGIEMIDAENARADARELWSAGHPSADPSLASLFHHTSLGSDCGERPTFAGVVLPASVVVRAVLSARQKLTPLRDALSGEGARLDRICQATTFRTEAQPSETWVRLTQADAQMIKASWQPSLTGYGQVSRIH